MPDLETFKVVGLAETVRIDFTDAGFAPDRRPMTCLVDFIPRLKSGQVVYSTAMTPPRIVNLERFQGRYDHTDAGGILKTIEGGSTLPGDTDDLSEDYLDYGIELIANTVAIGLPELIYDVVFTNVVPHRIINAFGLLAPTEPGKIINLATVHRLPYVKPGARA